MRIASLVDVKAHLSAYVDQARAEGPIVITRHGKVAAVRLAPRDDDDLESLLLTHSPRFQELLEKAREGIRAGGGLTEEELWKALEADLANYGQ